MGDSLSTRRSKEGCVYTEEVTYSQWCREEILSLKHQLEKEHVWNPIHPPPIRAISPSVNNEGKSKSNGNGKLIKNKLPKVKKKMNQTTKRISIGLFSYPKLEIASAVCWMSANI